MKGGSHRPTAFGWINHSEDNGETVAEVGGAIIPVSAEHALNIGDGVFISSADNVDKSNVAADYLAAAGIVVGGSNTNMEVVQDDALIGTQAAAAGGVVLVCVSGVAKVIAKSAIAVGDKVTADTTDAGKVKTAAVTTDLSAGDTGRILGTAFKAAAADGDVIRILVNIQ